MANMAKTQATANWALHVDLDPVPALIAAPRQIQILRKSSLPLSPSLAGDKQPLPPKSPRRTRSKSRQEPLMLNFDDTIETKPAAPSAGANAAGRVNVVDKK